MNDILQCLYSAWAKNIFHYYEGESNENLKYFLFFIMDDMVCWSDSNPDVQLFHSLLRGDSRSRWLQLLQWPLVSLLGVPDQVQESVTELMPFMNFLVHLYTCFSDRHASPYWIFICWWILMGFTTSLIKELKKRTTERCSSLVHVASRAAIFTLLLRRRVAFLHRTATCRPLFKPWVSLLSTYKTIELCFEFLSHF